jgi:NAD(P)-dependent dehydrogenase (short-subunit alcohol dehydrogenase family)
VSAFDLTERVALVTGAVGLLGREHCRALRRAGAHVVVADLDAGAAESFADELRREASPAAPREPEVVATSLDVTDRGALEAARELVYRRFDRLDVLVNNAAINDMFESPQAGAELSRFEHYPLELWRRSLDVNVTGVFLACQVLGTAMARAARGSIINVASTYGLVAPDQKLYVRPDGSQSFYKSAAYPATKGAVLSFTRFLAAYWGAAGVRVNALCPGGIENGQEEYFLRNYAARTPLGRMGKRDEMGGAIVFLASEASSYVTGSALVVDGGWTAW